MKHQCVAQWQQKTIGVAPLCRLFHLELHNPSAHRRLAQAHVTANLTNRDALIFDQAHNL
jgi:hypothetical protein